jgi:hypothetical protein
LLLVAEAMCNNNSVSCKLLSLLLLCEEVTAQKAQRDGDGGGKWKGKINRVCFNLINFQLGEVDPVYEIFFTCHLKLERVGDVWGSSYVCMLVNPL